MAAGAEGNFHDTYGSTMSLQRIYLNNNVSFIIIITIKDPVHEIGNVL